MRGGLPAALIFVVVGLALIVRTVQAGIGGGLGLIFGSLLLLAGALRLYLLKR